MSDDPVLSADELHRYSRHILIPDFGLASQQRLKRARVLVVGAGGLGCPLLLYLTAAGVGTIGIVDFDVVDESNLQRQVLYTNDDVGHLKVDRAIQHLRARNPHVSFVPYPVLLDSSNAFDILGSYDVIADGTDNFATRYLTNDTCLFLDKPLVYGSIFQFDGQVSVFNHRLSGGTRGPNYRDLYPMPPPPGTVPSCAEAGVLGVLPGIIGSLQAVEVIKILTGIGEPLSGRLLIFDVLRFEARILRFNPDPDNPVTGERPTIHGLIDYDQFCRGGPAADMYGIAELTAKELRERHRNGEALQLIDVREPFERRIVDIGGELIPLGELESHLDRIAHDRPVILYCKTGSRSLRAAQILREKGFDNVWNLKGGIVAYIDEIDPTLRGY
jgi:adenylyltransferase/sulfurtransferase